MTKKTKKDNHASLKKRMKKSYEQRDGGGSRSSAIDWSSIKDIKFYEPKEGNNKIDIIPYLIKGKNDPLVRSGDADIGDESYMMELALHTYVGATKAEIICPKSNFFKECPICAQAQEIKDSGKIIENSLWPSKFCFYNVIDRKHPEEGMQVLKIKFNKFEKVLITASRAAVDEEDENGDNEFVDFSSIDEGKTIKFWGEKVTKKIGKNNATYLEFSNFQFTDRKTPLDESLREEAISFSDLIKIPTTEYIEKMMFDEEDDDNEEQEETTTSRKSKGKKAKPEPEDEEEDDEEEDDEEEDDEEEAPPPKRGRPAKSVTTPEKKPEKTTGKKAKNPCPYGYKFGTDCNKNDECEDDCDEWSDCLKEQNALKKKGK